MKPENSIYSYKTKNNRKLKKYSNILSKDLDIQCVETPTKILAVCNAGLMTGLQEEVLVQTVEPYGQVESVVLLPGKAYSFIEFHDIDSAQRAFGALNGKLFPELKKGQLFVAYAERAPSSKTECTKHSLPDGLILVEEFVNPEEETELLACIDWKTTDTSSGQALKHRRVRHYGYQFNYDTNNVDPSSPLAEGLPKACDVVSDRLLEKGLVSWRPDQLTVNQYQPGQGIPPHIDTHSAFQEPIISLSLGADVIMEFRHAGQHVPVMLPRRSLLLMTGESRFCWSHGITPRKLDIVASPRGGLSVQSREVRTSFTLRRLLRQACSCSYPQYCDSQRDEVVTPCRDGSEEICVAWESDVAAARLEQMHVHQVYEEIAGHFSETRHKPWPNVLAFVKALPPGSVMLDVGCGNGKYLGHNKDIVEMGCDSSMELLKVCRERAFEAFSCNCLQLPLGEASVDCCISIAVIHHLSTQERRLRAVQEMARVLRLGGRALIYVWARDQAKDKVKSHYLKQQEQPTTTHVPSVPAPTSPFSLPVHTNRTPFAHPDMLVPWKLKGTKEPEVFYRFYHVFEEGELEALCERVEGLRVERSYYDQGNWCVILVKTMDCCSSLPIMGQAFPL